MLEGATSTRVDEEFSQKGYRLVPQAIPIAWIDDLLNNYMSLVREVTGLPFSDPMGADLVAFYHEHRDVESAIYGMIRRTAWLEAFSAHESIVGPVKQLLGPEVGVFRKIPFRIDMPMWTEELAHWHQDFFYVRGNTQVITAWIPLQDTTFLNGCLSVMPGTHLMGPIEHDLVIGKKRTPSTIFGNEIRMVEMRKGDLLLFDSLLLHTGNLNLAPGIRYSVQPRFTPLGLPTDEDMGGVIPLTEKTRA
jgi:hypothetical protein